MRPLPRGRKVRSFQGVDGEVPAPTGAGAQLLALVQHRGVILLAFADHHPPTPGHFGQGGSHGGDGIGVGGVLVPSAHPPEAGHGRGLGGGEEVQGEPVGVAVRLVGRGGGALGGFDRCHG